MPEAGILEATELDVAEVLLPGADDPWISFDAQNAV